VSLSLFGEGNESNDHTTYSLKEGEDSARRAFGEIRMYIPQRPARIFSSSLPETKKKTKGWILDWERLVAGGRDDRTGLL